MIKIKELNDVLESYPHIRQRLLGLMDAAVQWPRDEVRDIHCICVKITKFE